MISGTPETGANEERIQGFLKGLEEHGHRLWIAEDGVFSYESGCFAATRMFSSDVRPDGVFCLNDEIALGLMDTARTRFGLSIPEDISVIGYDDIPISGWPTYQLTTIHQPTDQLIKECVNVILSLRESPEEEKTVTIPVKLIERSTLCKTSSNER
jgi:DNA-binding LacI/PurR family transcriptional regulator